RVHRMAEPDPFDAAKQDQPAAILGLRENQDGADLRDTFRQYRRGHGRGLTGRVREIALVERDVLDADDPAIRLELRDAIDQQERVAMRQDPFDDADVEGKGESVHRNGQYNSFES